MSLRKQARSLSVWINKLKHLEKKGKSVFLDHIKSAFEYHSRPWFILPNDSPNILRWGYSVYSSGLRNFLQNYEDIVEILRQKHHHIPYFLFNLY